MYTVKVNEAKLRFISFEDVIKWAWNVYKIDARFLDVMDEDLCHQACDELSIMIATPVKPLNKES